MASQDAIPQQLEPATAIQIPRLGYRRQRTSRKPALVQQTVIAKAMIGDTKSQIARDLDISRSTVVSILSQAEISQHVSELRSDIIMNGDLVKSARVLRTKLNKGSESAATTILRGFNVLQSNPRVEINIANIGAQSYSQRMLAKQAEQESITVEPQTQAESSGNGNKTPINTVIVASPAE